jgi:hypothetical protein
MKRYLVVWEIDVFDVENPREAAKQAMEIQHDPTSVATVFDVFDEDGNKTHIDLLDEED